MKPRSLYISVLVLVASLTPNGQAEPVAVRYREGEMHGFVELQTLAGKNIAYGESIQTVSGNRVTSRLVFRFLDGSLYDDTTEFSQGRTFRLIRDHVVQKGPAFKQPLDATVDATRSEVTVRSHEKDGNEKSKTEQLQIPEDAANGLLFTIVKDVPEDGAGATVSYVATTSKPRIVKIHIVPEGRDVFSVGTVHKQARHYVSKFEIGGISGVIAPLVGKQPPDINSWTVAGNAPSVVRIEAPLEADGPVWRIQTAQPPVFGNQRGPARRKVKGRMRNGGRS